MYEVYRVFNQAGEDLAGASKRASERERERKKERIRKREKKKELRETDIEVYRFRHTSPSIKVRQTDHTKRE